MNYDNISLILFPLKKKTNKVMDINYSLLY
jgi:hypothetical protein